MNNSIVLLASGSGTLAQAIFEAVRTGELDVNILGLISDQPDAQVLKRSEQFEIPTWTLPMKGDRAEWNLQLANRVADLNPDLVVSVGFMRILSPSFVSKFKVINSHPSLLPKFPGAHAVEEALTAGMDLTGASVHWVDAGIDTGKIIAQVEVPILSGENKESLHERIKIAERELIVKTLNELLPTL